MKSGSDRRAEAGMIFLYHTCFLHTCPQSLNTELDKLMFVVVGARDFSPEITVLPIGTEVPCSDRVPPQIPIYLPFHHLSSSALMKGAVGDLARASWRTVPWAVMVPPAAPTNGNLTEQIARLILMPTGLTGSSYRPGFHFRRIPRQNSFADFRRAGAI